MCWEVLFLLKEKEIQLSWALVISHVSLSKEALGGTLKPPSPQKTNISHFLDDKQQLLEFDFSLPISIIYVIGGILSVSREEEERESKTLSKKWWKNSTRVPCKLWYRRTTKRITPPKNLSLSLSIINICTCVILNYFLVLFSLSYTLVSNIYLNLSIFLNILCCFLSWYLRTENPPNSYPIPPQKNSLNSLLLLHSILSVLSYIHNWFF